MDQDLDRHAVEVVPRKDVPDQQVDRLHDALRDRLFDAPLVHDREVFVEVSPELQDAQFPDPAQDLQDRRRKF